MSEAAVYDAAIVAVDELLARCGYKVTAKAVSILTRPGYDSAVRQLLRLISATASGPDQRAMKQAAAKLDADWGNMSPERRNAVIEAAAGSILKVPPIVVPGVQRVVAEQAAKVIEAARGDNAQAHQLKIAPSLTEADQRIADFAGRSQANYITDAYGQRAVAFEQRARDIVAHGLEAGWGTDDIGEALGRQLIEPGLRKADSYWHMVASVHTTRARSWGTLSSFQDAGIDGYTWSAVGDEATCDVCDFIDGKDFSTGDAVQRYLDVEDADDPTDVEDMQPWVQTGTDEDGGRYLFATVGDERHILARVTRSTEGEKDTRGTYSHAVSSQRLQSLGIDSPPAHGECRCLLIPS